jgi:hypothetical protein
MAFPLMYRLWGNRFDANLSICDLPNPGSPNNKIWLDYLKLVLVLSPLEEPPMIASNNPAFIS